MDQQILEMALGEEGELVETTSSTRERDCSFRP
jgi:hypothetical protein